MAFQYSKAKSAAKRIDVKGPKLDDIMLSTMKNISDAVGATLGPGGCPVLIERQEFNLAPMVTKDGVTVMRSLGYADPVQHTILEAARDAAVRTASEAGDGTTTATILAYSIVQKLHAYCKANPRVSPQRVVRRLEQVFKTRIEPAILGMALEAKLEDDTGRAFLEAVAKVSANGDGELAQAVMECFDLVGDSGNVTITESSGSSHYEVEKINGFPVAAGLEDCCLRFAPDFTNEPGTQKSVIQKCGVVLYHGRLSSFASIAPLMEKVFIEYTSGTDQEFRFPALLIVATGFSDDAISGLAVNFKTPATMKAFPLVAPVTAEPGSQLQFLEDLAAITGATILDQTGTPLEQAQLLHLGRGVDTFEASRWRSNIIMTERRDGDDELNQKIQNDRELRVIDREAAVKEQLRDAPSEFTKHLVEERLAKLTGGIARLKVIGASNGELKEKRDRAEDAVCGVRGAIKHGCLPGGCWTLLNIINELEKLKDPILDAVLIPALMAPFDKLLQNAGIVDDEEVLAISTPIIKSIREPSGKDPETQEPIYRPMVYDVLECKHVDAIKGGILDSVPAVLEAVRNALSIGSLMGTLGGTVVFLRDAELERDEARRTAEYLDERGDDVNPANDRG